MDANEAVHQALLDMHALSVLFETVDSFSGQIQLRDLEVLTFELPTLIALPALLSSPNVDKGSITGTDVAEFLGLEKGEYRSTCLSGFGREEECAETVVKRLLEVFSSGKEDEEESMLVKWLKDEIA